MQFFDLDLTEVVPPAASSYVPTEVRVPKNITLGTALNWVITGKVVGYDNNRGIGKISPKTRKSCQEEVDPDSIGQMVIANWKGQITFCDWQSRMVGFLDRYIGGNMSKSELDTVVNVVLAGDFLNAYRKLNDHDPHTNAAKIANRDLLYGDILGDMKDQLSVDCVKMVGHNKGTVLSSILYSLKKIGRNCEGWEWTTIYQTRAKSKDLTNNAAGEGLTVSKKDVSDMTDAIQYWYELMLALGREIGKKDASAIQRSAGFFGFIVMAKLTPGNFMPTSIKTVVNRIKNNLTDMTKICPELCRGNQLDVIRYTAQLRDKILKLRVA